MSVALNSDLSSDKEYVTAVKILVDAAKASSQKGQQATDKSEISLLRDAIKTANQALLEVEHARLKGPDWYTRGASGLYQHVAMWVKRGLDATGKHLGG